MSDAVIGIDLGASSLKLVALSPKNNSWEVTGVGIVANPIGRLTATAAEEKNKLAIALKSAAKSLRVDTRKVRVGLAESQVFTRVIQLPVLSEAELASAIQWEAEQHIPIPLAEAQLDYSVISRPEKGIKEGNMRVLLVAAKKSVVTELASLFAMTDLGKW